MSCTTQRHTLKLLTCVKARIPSSLNKNSNTLSLLTLRKHVRHFHRGTGSSLALTKLQSLNRSDNRRRYHSAQASTNLTRDEEEITKFEKLAQHWWNESGDFAALHSLNKLRIPLIRDGLLGQNVLSSEKTVQFSSLPLEGMSIVDVGCGGGILCEPLARLGANVLGLDAGEENINIARLHMKHDPVLLDKLTYVCSTVEDLAITDEGRHDAVVASEVIEHVKEPLTFLHACSALLKPGGSIFITTLNKTAISYGLAIFAAEQILRIVPAGSHDWDKFIPPEDLQFLLNQSHCSTRLIHGMTLNPLTNQWKWISSTSMNYAVHAVKDDPHPENHSSSTSSESSDES